MGASSFLRPYLRFCLLLLAIFVSCEGDPWYGSKSDRGELVVRFTDKQTGAPVNGISVAVFDRVAGEKVASGTSGDRVWWNFYGTEESMPPGVFQVKLIAGRYWMTCARLFCDRFFELTRKGRVSYTISVTLD